MHFPLQHFHILSSKIWICLFLNSISNFFFFFPLPRQLDFPNSSWKFPSHLILCRKWKKCTWNDLSRNQLRLTGVIFTFLPGYVTVSVLYWCLRLTSISMLEHRWDDWLFMVNNYRRCRAGNRSFVCACRLNVNVSICCRVKKGVKRRHIREYG